MLRVSENLATAPVVEPSPAISIPGRNVRNWVLSNGLTIIVEEDHSAPVVSVQAWCATGSIHEDKFIGSGLSHILEHMLFKGTKTRSPNKIATEVQDEGGYINAYTSFDRTVYWIETPSAGAAKAVDVLADAVVNATLPDAEYVKEQEVIRREFAMGYDDPDRMTSLLLFSTAYREHPYSHPVIGHLSIYNTLTREDVMNYYRARYVPNNIFFVVVGDVDGEKIRAQLAEFFASYPRVVLPPVFIPEEAPQLGKREVHQEFRTELTRLMMAWHIPGIAHPDTPALEVLGTIMGSGRSSRFYRRLREEKGLVFSVNCSAYTPYHPGLLAVSAATDPRKRDEAAREIEAMFHDVAQHGVDDSEVLRAQKMLLASQINRLATTRGRASDLGSGWLLVQNLDFGREYIEAIQKVTPVQVQAAVWKYVRTHNQTVVSLNPPAKTAVSVQADVTHETRPVRKFVLSNGLRLLVREDSRLPLVSANIVFKGGLLAETPETAGISRLFTRTLLKGTTNRLAEQIHDEIESAGGNISSDSGNNSFAISADATAPDLSLVLELIADVVLNPTLPEKAIDREREVQLAGQKAEQEHMTSVARILLRSTIFPNHPYGLRPLGTAASITSITRDHLLAYHRKYVAAQNGALAVFGDVKADQVVELCERYFASLPAGESALERVAQPTRLAQSETVEQIEHKSQAVLMTGYQTADMFSPDKPALDLIEEACSDLGSRFFVTIRENLGLAYFVGASQLTGLAAGLFNFYVGTDPKKAGQVLAAIQKEIDLLASEGLTGTELERAKKKIIGQQEIQNQSNESLAYSCALHELYGLGYDHYLGAAARINAVSLEDIRHVAAKYFLDQPRVIASVHPPETSRSS
ncbi:MAG TPA: pitrilysin family protein [Chthoniobacterales bacterium]